ncbi:lipopolysaccharide biosynthesis protein [Hyphomonas johnsonii]|uniref:Polysaccharide biosynthesis family protein n=1 Tax=Hyphomonas johnsonii MHS-2 TaxID=1280950 RepID=A0A059FBN1_9PROT|nr:oligosaccharide flippase family protein [Hyphomonas johnsonii]KCZ87948.1 polysaccharide biosynthesis family protein [Hyphomonas johnsonii MHS-2]
MTIKVRQDDGPIKRAIRNAGWLLAGKGVGGVFSLVYLGLAAQSLGAERFGVFALILSYGQAVSNLAQFQSWQTLIRYGAAHEAAGDYGKLRRVIWFTVLLDIGAALVGAALGIAGVYLVGGQLGWSGEEQTLALLFCTSLLFGLRGTPTGILRLFDRFDTAAYAETVLPAMRLAGALLAWLTGASILGYLVAWSLAELATTAAIWWASLREVKRRNAGHVHTKGPRLRGVVGENPDIWKFAWATNLTTSLRLVWKQFPVLAVGWALDSVAAGGLKIATQLAGAIHKPTLALARSVYPELAKLALGAYEDVRRVVVRSSVAAGMAGILAVAIMAIFGRFALDLVGGDAYSFVYSVLVVLTIAAAVELCGVVVEPALVALGRPWQVLLVRVIVAAVYVPLLVWMIQAFGLIGAAWATVCSSLMLVACLYAVFRRAVNATASSIVADDTRGGAR